MIDLIIAVAIELCVVMFIVILAWTHKERTMIYKFTGYVELTEEVADLEELKTFLAENLTIEIEDWGDWPLSGVEIDWESLTYESPITFIEDGDVHQES